MTVADRDCLLRLIQRVPVLAVDVARAAAAGNVEAVRYARAIGEWRAEADAALSGANGGGWVNTRGLGGAGPLGDASSELVSRDFSTGRGA